MSGDSDFVQVAQNIMGLQVSVIKLQAESDRRLALLKDIRECYLENGQISHEVWLRMDEEVGDG